MTGYGQEADRRRTEQAGFRHHLVKPVDITALEAALDGLDAASLSDARPVEALERVLDFAASCRLWFSLKVG